MLAYRETEVIPSRSGLDEGGNNLFFGLGLSMKEGGDIGIKIPLPKDHALKRIRYMFRPIPYIPVDEDIQAISFGLQYVGNQAKCSGVTDAASNYDIYPIALGKTQSYLLDTQLFNTLPRYPQDEEEKHITRLPYTKEPIIYMDDQLDMVVSIGRDEEKAYAPYIDIQTYEQTRTKRALLRQEVEKRNKLIFGDNAR